MSRLLTVIAILALVAGTMPVSAEVIELKDGSKIEGKITAKSATEVTVNTEGAEVKVGGDEIKAIDGLPFVCDYKQMYELRAAETLVNDIEGHYRLALWCRDHKMTQEMNDEIEQVLAVDPNHEGANKMLGRLMFQGQWRTPEELKRLGFVKKDGQWLTPDQAAQAQGKVTYKGSWVCQDDRKLLEARQFSKYLDDDCSFATHAVVELERDIKAIQLLNMWNPAPQQLRQMWAVLNDAEADRQVFLQKRSEAAEEIESAWISLRNEALKGVVDSFDQDRGVEARAGAASGLCKSLAKGCDFKLNTHTDKFMSILTPPQKHDFQTKYCGSCHSTGVAKGIGGRELRGSQAGVDFLTKVRLMREDEFNAKQCDLAEEALKKFGKGPQTLLGKKAVRTGKRSKEDMDAEEMQVASILTRARLMPDTEFDRKKFNIAAEMEAPNQEARLRAELNNSRQKMGQLKKNQEMMGMLSDALFDGALRRAVAAKLGIPPQQQIVKASKDKPTVPEYGDGETAFKATCTQCHSMDRINKATKDPVGWRETVQRMMKGSFGDMSKNINLITDYLINRGSKTQRADAK